MPPRQESIVRLRDDFSLIYTLSHNHGVFRGKRGLEGELEDRRRKGFEAREKGDNPHSCLMHRLRSIPIHVHLWGEAEITRKEGLGKLSPPQVWIETPEKRRLYRRMW